MGYYLARETRHMTKACLGMAFATAEIDMIRYYFYLVQF